jgi:hypothetical protein
MASEPVAPIESACSTAPVSSFNVADSMSRRTFMYSRVPAGPRSASRRRRSTEKHSGRSQPSSGRATSKAPGFLSKRAR